jgi:three-Cys-motif partner protein
MAAKNCTHRPDGEVWSVMNFGGQHTKIKLDVLGSYLDFYVKALKNSSFHLVYIDAFAGTGDMLIDGIEEPSLFSVGREPETYEGSVRRAIKLPFDSYWLVEKNQARHQQLQNNLAELTPQMQNKIILRCGDSDKILREFASTIRGKINGKFVRAVVFLDPFGMSLSYETMKALGDTCVADIWFLMPTGMGPVRQASRTMDETKRFNGRITRMLGTEEWQAAWYTKVIQGSFDGSVTETKYRTNDLGKMEAYIFDRINGAFNRGAHDKMLTLGRGGRRWYKLMFACANPNSKARDLAFKAADHIIKKAGGR